MKKLLKKKSLIKISLLLFLLFFCLIPQNNASADNLNDAFSNANYVASSSGYKTTTIYSIIGSLILTALSFVGVIFIVLMIFAGFQWMTAAGNEQKTEKAKLLIKQSIIGTIIVLAAYIITYFIIQIFGSQIKI